MCKKELSRHSVSTFQFLRFGRNSVLKCHGDRARTFESSLDRHSTPTPVSRPLCGKNQRNCSQLTVTQATTTRAWPSSRPSTSWTSRRNSRASSAAASTPSNSVQLVESSTSGCVRVGKTHVVREDDRESSGKSWTSVVERFDRPNRETGNSSRPSDESRTKRTSRRSSTTSASRS